MKRRATICSVGLMLAVLAGSAWAQTFRPPPGRWWDKPRVVSELDLTDDQREALEAATLAHARSMVDLKAAVEKAQLELRIVSEQEPFDAGKVRARFGALQQARLALESERFEMLLKTRGIVTPAQWRALTTMVRERLGNPRLGEDGADAGGRPRRLQKPRGF